MAQLTWRNVDAPNFSGVTESYRLMGQLLNGAFTGLQDTLGDFEKSRQDQNTSNFLAGLSKYTDSAALEAAQKSGAIFDGVNRGALSPDAIKYGLERQRQLLGDQTVRLNNQGQVIANDASQFNLDTSRRNDSQAQARLAAQPEAAKLLADVRLLAGSGDPAKVEQARDMIARNSQILLNAGYQADALPGLLDAERAAGTAGFAYKKDLLENRKFWEQQGISEDAQKIAFDAINGNATPDVAIRAIQGRKDITDPRIKAQAISVVQQAGENRVFQQADPGQQLLMSLGVQPAAQPSAPAGSANPLVSLIDRTEGGGRYDTLYGHSQRSGGAFAGVDVSKMTIGQLKEFSSNNGAYGRHQKQQLGYLATPMGRFQIVGSTLSAAAKEMGLPDNTVFTPEVQNAVFNHLVDKRIGGPRTMAGKIENLRQEWEGFKSVPNEQLAQAITAYENGNRGVLTGMIQGAGQNPPDLTGMTAQTPVSSPQITLPVGSDPASQLAQTVMPTAAPVEATPQRQEPPSPPAPEQSLAARGEALLNALSEQDRLPPPIAESQAQAEAARLAQSVQPAQAPGGAVVLNGTSPTAVSTDSPAQAAQKLLDQSIIDRTFNTNAPLVAQIQAAQSSTETVAEVARRLVAEGGPIPSGNEQAVMQAITETMAMSGNKLSPAGAGAVVANNSESRDLTSLLDWVLPGSWVNGDRFSNDKENAASATRTNMEGVARDLKQIGWNVDGSINLARGTGQIENQRLSSVTQQQVAAIHEQLTRSQAEAANIMMAIQSGQDTPANRAALAQALAVIEQLNTILRKIGAEPGSPTTIFSGAGEARPAQ